MPVPGPPAARPDIPPFHPPRPRKTVQRRKDAFRRQNRRLGSLRIRPVDLLVGQFEGLERLLYREDVAVPDRTPEPGGKGGSVPIQARREKIVRCAIAP